MSARGLHRFARLSLLGGLLLGSVLRPSGAQADVLVPRGDTITVRQTDGTEIPLQLRALIAARPASPDPAEAPQVQTLHFSAFQPDETGLSAQAATAEVAVRLHVGWQSGAGFTLSILAEPLQRTWARQVAVELELDADGAQVLGRDLRALPVDVAPVVLGRLDPKWVQLVRRGRPLLTLVLSDDADGLQVSRARGRVKLHADLLAVEARPFFHFAACTEYWKDPNQRLTLPVRLFEPGERMEARLSIYPGGTLPLLKGRYPEGRRAAFVITDHADQTAIKTLRALAGGTSDVNDPRWGQGGLLGYGLPITKALWLRSGDRDPSADRLLQRRQKKGGPGAGRDGKGGKDVTDGRDREELAALPGPMVQEPADELLEPTAEQSGADENGGGRPQLDDPQVVSLADRLYAAGWEVIPHSATPVRDSRDLTDRALSYFRRFAARSWIDHQPYTNCEALVNQGYRPGPFWITDLLLGNGYRYAWAGQDMPPGDLNLLMPQRVDRYVPVLWPVGRLAQGTQPGLWLFRSMLSFIETPRFFEMYSVAAMDRLERERGLHIAHTYLEDFHPPHSWFGKRNLLVPGRKPREVVLHPRLDAFLAGLAARVARGSLWVPTLVKLGDYMRDVSAVEVTVEADGSATLRSKVALRGVTLVVPRPGVTVTVSAAASVDGAQRGAASSVEKPPRGLRSADGETCFWLDLPRDRPVRVKLRGPGGEPLGFLVQR